MFNGCKRYNNSEMPKKCEKKNSYRIKCSGILCISFLEFPHFLEFYIVILLHVIEYITTEHLPKRVQSEH